MTHRVTHSVTHSVTIGAGSLRLPSATYTQFFGGVSSAALVSRDGQVWLLPLRGPVAGGLLLKQRNLRGDRVMLATDFLAPLGLGPEAGERGFEVRWVDEAQALLIVGLGATPA